MVYRIEKAIVSLGMLHTISREGKRTKTRISQQLLVFLGPFNFLGTKCFVSPQNYRKQI